MILLACDFVATFLMRNRSVVSFTLKRSKIEIMATNAQPIIQSNNAMHTVRPLRCSHHELLLIIVMVTHGVTPLGLAAFTPGELA